MYYDTMNNKDLLSLFLIHLENPENNDQSCRIRGMRRRVCLSGSALTSTKETYAFLRWKLGSVLRVSDLQRDLFLSTKQSLEVGVCGSVIYAVSQIIMCNMHIHKHR